MGAAWGVNKRIAEAMADTPAAPRSLPRRPRSPALGGALAVLAMLGLPLSAVGGCSISASNDELSADGSVPPEIIPTGSASLTSDSGAGDVDAKEPLRGSPLCQATKTTCWPDEGAVSCGGAAAADAGAIDGGNLEVDSCRVTLGGPSCTPSGKGAPGDMCSSSSDCAAGSDCVLRADGMGQCRKYCCGGTCSNVGSPSGGATFCDVVQLNEEASVIVPVCMPVKACKLLTSGQCEQGETCAIAADDGTTSCVRVGQAKAGEACDDTHCGAGLTCVGKPGARKCFQLCRVSAPSCTGDFVCKPSSLIRDVAIGLCQGR